MCPTRGSPRPASTWVYACATAPAPSSRSPSPPAAVAYPNALVADVSRRPITHDLRSLTAARIAARRASAEGREGLAAFLEKRKSEWTPR